MRLALLTLFDILCHIWHIEVYVRISVTIEFQRWLTRLSDKSRGQMNARLERIENHGYFGDTKYLGDELFELRWANGWRVYYTQSVDFNGNIILLLLGGMKNAQKKDIKKARHLAQKYKAR